MIPILLASHGDLCEALRNTLKMIAGDTFGIVAVPLFPGETAECYREKLSAAIREAHGENGILILTDIVGGTPYNSAVYLSSQAVIGIVAGMNMPMLLTLGFSRDEESTLDALIALAIKQDTIGVKGMYLNKERGERRAKLSINKN